MAPLLAAPVVTAACAAFAPHVVRRVGLLLAAVGLLASTVLAAADAPLVAVVVAGALGVAAFTSLAATGPALLPGAAVTPRDLVSANHWSATASAACVLAGPLLASLLMAAGSTATAIGGAGVLAALGLIASLGHRGAAGTTSRSGSLRASARVARSLARHPGGPGLVAGSFARGLLVGALDVLVVVLAFEAFGTGGSGAALLSASFGAGAVLSLLVAPGLLHRPDLPRVLMAAMAVIAALCLVLAAVAAPVAAAACLVGLGAGAAVVRTVARALLQRSADPARLGTLFGLLTITDGVALLGGSLLAQAVVPAGRTAALVSVAAVLAAIALLSARSLRRSDAGSAVPVVEMSLLRQTEIFGPLSPVALETLARQAVYRRLAKGEHAVRQGEHGDEFFVVADGAFDVVDSGTWIRTAHRGGSFGEVALLTDVPRIATVTAATDGVLLVVERAAFLSAVTGADRSLQAAWEAVDRARGGPPGVQAPHA